MRLESQLSRRNCQTFSTGLSSGAFRRQRNDGDVCRHHKTGRQVPAGLIDQEDGVGVGRDSFGDFRQVQVHGLGVAGRQDQGGALALVWADRAEDVGGSGALVTRRAGTGAALCQRAAESPQFWACNFPHIGAVDDQPVE